MKEITLSKSNLAFAILLGVFLGFGLLVLELWPLSFDPDSSAEKMEELHASQAVVQAIEQIFRVDTKDTKDAWLLRFCETSTKAGCVLFTSSSDALWARYVADKTMVTAQAKTLQKLVARNNEQVWKVEVSLSAPLPGSNKTEDTAYVAMLKEGGVWMFDRFLLPAEIEAIQIRQKTVTPTARKVAQ